MRTVVKFSVVGVESLFISLFKCLEGISCRDSFERGKKIVLVYLFKNKGCILSVVI